MRAFVVSLLVASWVYAGGSIFGSQPTSDPLPGGGVRVLGLGGAGLALSDSLGTHSENAASMAFMTGSVLRAGFFTGLYGTKDDTDTDFDSDFGWQDFRLMLNVHPRYKTALGFHPLTRVDVRTFGFDSLAFPTDTGVVFEPFERRNVWQGSALDIRWDHAYKLSDKMAVGASFAFASEYKEVNGFIDFPPLDPNEGQRDSVQGARDVTYRDIQRFHGFWGGISLHVRPTDKFSVGAFWKSQAEGQWELERRVNHGGQAPFSEVDGTRPGEFGLGVGYSWSQVWGGYADLKLQTWKAKQYGPLYEEANVDDQDGLSVMCGVEKKGGTRITDEGFDRWDYRAGIAYRKQPWLVPRDGPYGDASETALSLGVSLPLAQQTGKLHSAIEIGIRSAPDADVTETFGRIHLQLDMHERWFQREQRKLRN